MSLSDAKKEEHTSLTSWNTGALTTAGLRACDAVRHSDVAMNRTDGMMEKKSCSNCTPKSKSAWSSCSRFSSPVEKGILLMIQVVSKTALKWEWRTMLSIV